MSDLHWVHEKSTQQHTKIEPLLSCQWGSTALPFTSMPSLREGNMQSSELTLNEHHTPSGGKSFISDLTTTPAAKSSEEQALMQKVRELEADKKTWEKKYQREL